jgi:hypothetical protein
MLYEIHVRNNIYVKNGKELNLNVNKVYAENSVVHY